jgi:hypothetical protein
VVYADILLLNTAELVDEQRLNEVETADCLLSDTVLDPKQAPLRQCPSQPTRSA